MEINRPFALLTWTLALSFAAATAAAQSGGPQISRRDGYFTFGGTMGVVLAETPDGIPDLAAHVEVPLASLWSVRGQIGRQREFAQVNTYTDTLTLRRYTASLVLFIPRWSGAHHYVFAGLGAYQFRYATSTAHDRTMMAGHFGVGIESPAIGPVVLNAEGTFRRDFRRENVSPLTLACGFKIRY